VRVGAAVKWLLVLGLANAARRHHGAPIDYVGLAAAAAASWVGVPGPGEPVLIAAGVLAAKHRLAISEVLLVAWVAATLGGIAGWQIGMIGGRTVLTARGPLHRLRLGAVAHGDQVFLRYRLVAILLTPSWVAGIHRVPTLPYLLINAASAALWAVGIGLGAYLIGPSVIDFVSDFGVITTAAVVLLVGGVIVAELVIHRRRRRGPGAQAADHPGKAGDHQGNAADYPGNGADHPGNAGDHQGKAAEHPGSAGELPGATRPAPGPDA
jgi:membrane protein DedA with SNARE-associated domain